MREQYDRPVRVKRFAFEQASLTQAARQFVDFVQLRLNMLYIHGSNNLLQSTQHRLSERAVQEERLLDESHEKLPTQNRSKNASKIKYPTLSTSPNSALELNNYSRANKST